MKELPILFSGPMVRAILEGRKTQTRRVVKNVSGDCELFIDAGDGNWQQCYRDESGAIHSKSWLTRCQYGVKGDRLWLREHHARIPGNDGWHEPHYFADGPLPTVDQRHDAGLLHSYPSIHMPRWASRINLEITGIRVERLHAIRAEDALAEGVEWDGMYEHPRDNFISLWESINGHGSWDANPWVWVVEFKRV